jgi:hypothetical protein
MLDFVGGAIKFGSDEPWTCEGIDELIDLTPAGIGLGCLTSKNHVAN